MARISTLKVGDKVGYSKKFLQSTGQYTGPIPFARGVITELKAYGIDFTLATVDWDTPEAPEKVNVKNLAKVGSVNF